MTQKKKKFETWRWNREKKRRKLRRKKITYGSRNTVDIEKVTSLENRKLQMKIGLRKRGKPDIEKKIEQKEYQKKQYHNRKWSRKNEK